MPAIDRTNRFMVSGRGKKIALLNPPHIGEPFSVEEALVLAAWLVAMAEHEASFDFEEAQAAVQNT